MTNLEELMMEEGQFMNVANVKKGSIEERIVTTKNPIKVKVLAEKVDKVKWDLRYKFAGDTGKFEFSEEFFNSIPELDKAGVGFSEFYIPSLNKTVLILCEEGVDNKFKVTPKFLNTKKGAKKSLLFKAMSFEFYAIKSDYIKKNEEGTWLFNLTQETTNVFGLTPATVVVEVSADDEVIDNSPVITEMVEVPLSGTMESVSGTITAGSSSVTVPQNVTYTREAELGSLNTQVVEEVSYNPAYLADILDEATTL